MQAEYINPFIQSVYDLFNSMLGCEARLGKIGVIAEEDIGRERELIALIGLSGPVRGTVALAFPIATALQMVNRLLGIMVVDVNDEVLDAVAELVNIVGGGAKAKLSGGSQPISLSLPTVIRGTNYTVESPSYSKWFDVPFESELGTFTLRIILQSDKKVVRHEDAHC